MQCVLTLKNKDIRCQSRPGLSVQTLLLYGLYSESRFAQAVCTGRFPKCSCCCAERGDKKCGTFYGKSADKKSKLSEKGGKYYKATREEVKKKKKKKQIGNNRGCREFGFIHQPHVLISDSWFSHSHGITGHFPVTFFSVCVGCFQA